MFCEMDHGIPPQSGSLFPIDGKIYVMVRIFCVIIVHKFLLNLWHVLFFCVLAHLKR